MLVTNYENVERVVLYSIKHFLELLDAQKCFLIMFS